MNSLLRRAQTDFLRFRRKKRRCRGQMGKYSNNLSRRLRGRSLDIIPLEQTMEDDDDVSRPESWWSVQRALDRLCEVMGNATATLEDCAKAAAEYLKTKIEQNERIESWWLMLGKDRSFTVMLRDIVDDDKDALALGCGSLSDNARWFGSFRSLKSG